MKTKIKIEDIFGQLLFEHEQEDNSVKVTLLEALQQGANLRDANLRDAKELPESFVNEGLQQIYFIAKHQIGEVPFLIKKLKEGKIDGSQYEGDCCCFVGTLADGKEQDIDEYCSIIPYYTKGTHNPAESWFLNIKEGDAPENNFFAEKALEALELALIKSAFPRAFIGE